MKRILTSRRGEMYIEAIITIIVIMAFVLFSISVLKIGTIKNTADTITDQLLETAAFYGGFGSEFEEKVTELQETYPGLEFTVTYEADWYNEPLKRVQLGDSMTVTLHYEITFGGFGSFITVPLTTVRTGASENFWKTS